MFDQCPCVSPIIWIPQADDCVAAATGKCVTIWTECNGLNNIGVSCEGSFKFPCCSIPQADRSVSTPAGERVTIWTEGDRRNSAYMFGQCPFQFSIAWIP